MKIITARPHRLLTVCIDSIKELTQAGKSCMLLVPSQYTLQAEIELINSLNLSGTFLIDVLSPTRLKSRIFERAGYPSKTPFDERGKCMLLSAVLEEEKDHLLVYRAAAQNGTSGIAQKLSSLIADFKRSAVSPQHLLDVVNKLPDDHPAKGKLTDVASIFALYTAKMGIDLADSEDIAKAAREKMKRSGVLDAQHVFVFGFDMITPAFAEDILEISSCAASLTLAVESDKNSAPDGRLFAPVNLSIDRLVRMAKERGIPVERCSIDAQLDASVSIQSMEKSLFALADREARSPDGIELLSASNPRTEVHLAASAIRSMLLSGDDPGEIAVFYPKGSVYAQLLENILPMYDLPVYTSSKRNAAGHPLCRFLLSALSIVSAGWNTGDVIECIQSGFLPLTQEEADALCSYAEGAGLRQDAWKHPFTHIKSRDAQELAALNESRERIVTPVLSFSKALLNANSADDTVRAVLALLDEVHAYDTLESMREILTGEGLPVQAEDCAQVWNRLMETLDQLHTLLGKDIVSASTVLSLLTSGLSAMELAALPPADGAIICGEIGNVRTARVKSLFVLGMNDEAASMTDGLLTPQEAEEAARATGAYLGMSASERTALAQLDTLKAFCCAKERLIISFSTADETGRALREGSVIQAMRRVFADIVIQSSTAKEELEQMLCAERPAALALSVLLSDAADGKDELTDRAKQVYAALNAQQQGREALLRVTRSLADPQRAPLDGSQARALYGRPVMSVSRLETFSQCPYRHFVRYGLSPQEEIKPGVDKAELGTIYHEAADAFTKAVTQLPEFPNIPPEICDQLMDEAIAPLVDDWRKSPLGKSARGASVARRIEKTARRAGRNIISQFSSSSFTPMRSEFVFGQRGMAPIILETADGTLIYLQGRIDRVDVLDGEGKIRVVDYKSGAKKFDPTMVYWGLQLQLLIYLAAALSQIPGSKAAGFFYCRIADPLIRSESRVKEEIEKQIAKKLSLAGISLSDVAVLRAHGDSHAAMITKEGRVNGRYAGSMIDEEGMEKLVSFAKRKACDLASSAYAGILDDSPTEHGQTNACELCDYAAVCGFDPTRKKRRRLTAKTLEDLL